MVNSIRLVPYIIGTHETHCTTLYEISNIRYAPTTWKLCASKSTYTPLTLVLFKIKT